jgi:predicted nucleic acid-binding protein
MAVKTSVLIDLNVILDVLQRREPFYDASAGFMALVEAGEIQGFVAAHSITTLFYLIEKNRSNSEARAAITSLLQFLKVLPVDQQTIEQALNLDFRDFEDAVQMVAALRTHMDCLITRNIKDYPTRLLSIMQPIDFLNTFNK